MPRPLWSAWSPTGRLPVEEPTRCRRQGEVRVGKKAVTMVMSTLYLGCQILEPIARAVNIPLDQVNFVASEIIALFLSIGFRYYLRPKDVGVTTRQTVAGLVGLFLGFFCFGKQMFHMLAQAGMCYAVMKFAPAHLMQGIVLAIALAYLSFMHIKRMSRDHGEYVLDVTGPLMISTQKLTSIAFSFHDGVHKKKDKLSADQDYHAVRRLPSLVEFGSYIFYFQGLLCGPLCFYNDFVRFMNGTNFTGKQVDGPENNDAGHVPEPSPKRAVVEKLVTAGVCLFITLFITPYALKVTNADPDFYNAHGFWYRFWFMIISVVLSRPKYYFAWKFGEAINNASGLGYNGKDERGEDRWDLVENVNIKKLETATSLKILIESWNIQTAIWLRRLCYERLKVQRTVLTYVLSAFWHGFYPGYYITFMGAAFFTPAARAVRRNFRPYFLTSTQKKQFYDLVTWFWSQLTLSYLIVPFTVLHFWPCLNFYMYSMFWWMHILVGVVLMILPAKPSSRSQGDAVKATDKLTDQVTDKVPQDQIRPEEVKKEQ